MMRQDRRVDRLPGEMRGTARAPWPTLLLLVLVMACAPEVARAQGGPSLRSMARVGIDIAMTQELPGLGIDTVEARVDRTLRDARPAPAIDPNSQDRLQVYIQVVLVTSSDLRGFYLPFSGQYGIGWVRLAVVRPVHIAGRQAPLPATVWQVERPARGPWRASGQEVQLILDDLLGQFLDDYRRPVP